MALSFLKNREQELNLIIDIASGSVAGALVISRKGEKPEVIFARRFRIKIEKDWNKNKIFTSLKEELDKLINLILKEGASKLHIQEKKLVDKAIKNVFCIFSSPWSSFQVKTLTEKKERPFSISSEVLDRMIENDTKNAHSDYSLIERKIIQTKLNGYKTLEPLDKRAKEIELTIFEGLVSKEEAEKVEKIISPALHGKAIFHSLSLITFIAINEMYQEDNNYLVIDITGETTETTLIKDDSIIDSYFFTQGRNEFVRKVTEEFGVETDIALSFVRLFYEKKTEANFQGKIEKVIKEIEYSWTNNFFKAMEGFRKWFLPSKIFLLVDQELWYPFPELIKKTYLKSPEKTSVNLITGNSLNQFCDFKENFDPFLAIEAIALNKIIKLQD